MNLTVYQQSVILEVMLVENSTQHALRRAGANTAPASPVGFGGTMVGTTLCWLQRHRSHNS